MEYNKRIDILMATYNGEKYVEEQVKSILNQSYKNINLIISDDGSNDRTREILKKLANQDERIKLHFQELNIGVISNFEFLMNQVTSEIFMFSDQDDIWKEFKVEHSLKKLLEDNAELIHTDLEVVDQDLNLIAESFWKLKGFYNKIIKYNNFDALYLNNFITGCTMMMKSKWINACLPLPKNSKYMLHDYWISLVVSQRGKISYLNEATIKYRQHGDNTIGSKAYTKSLKNAKEIRNLFIDVKIQHFSIFCDNENVFIKNEIKELNKKSLLYYKKLEKNCYFNLRNIGNFMRLYKYEDLGYRIKNFMVLHTFIIFKFLYNFVKYK